VLTYLGPLFRPVAKGGRVARPLNVAWPMPDGIGRVRVSFLRSHAQADPSSHHGDLYGPLARDFVPSLSCIDARAQ
jgi:hypothetical protein